VILLPSHLAEAIEWVLRPTRDAQNKPPDLTRLTSDQMQLLPLAVAHDFMELAIAAQHRPAARRKNLEAPRPTKPGQSWDPEPKATRFKNPYLAPAQPAVHGQWMNRLDPRSKQRARRERQRAELLAVAHERLLGWYVETASAQHRGFVK
jgi:hypothetical protein